MRKRRKSQQEKGKYLIVDQEPHSTVSEKFRTIRTNIMYSSIDKEISIVLFTSEQPGAGKSTISANMAVAYAQSGKKTLLFDADLRRPTAHHTFGVSNHIGVSTMIVNDLSLEEVIKETEFEMLDLITSGPIPPNPSELLSSSKLESIMKRLSAHYDMIIIDSPPVLTVTDAQLLSKISNGVVLITNTKNNNRDRLKKAKSQLEMAGANVIGVILNNQAKKSKEESYYYYYQQPEDA